MLRVASPGDCHGFEDLANAFAAAMAAMQPFEPAPHLAIAVSGGADSLALCLLAQAWATARGGQVVAMTVDHQLRAESAVEAATVGRWLAARGIDHRILAWRGPKPASGIQAAARRARYRLLDDACGAEGVLHLLVAHHAGDQLETLLMRTIAASGIHGLAAMQPVVTLPHCRLLRPLLKIDGAHLRRYLTVVGQPWIEDPSNRSDIYSRVRVRQALPSLEAAGLDAATLARITSTMQLARDATDEAVVGWLARGVSVHAAGYAEADLAMLRSVPRFLARQMLARLIATVGGGHWEPDEAAVDRLVEHFVSATLTGTGRGIERGTERRGRTLGRCRLSVRGDRLLVYRERRDLPPPVDVYAGGAIEWDGRFRITIQASGSSTAASTRLQAMQGLRPPSTDEREGAHAEGVPKLAWPSLPALVDDRGLAHVPHLGYIRALPVSNARIARVTFLTRRSLSDRDSFIV